MNGILPRKLSHTLYFALLVPQSIKVVRLFLLVQEVKEADESEARAGADKYSIPAKLQAFLVRGEGADFFVMVDSFFPRKLDWVQEVQRARTWHSVIRGSEYSEFQGLAKQRFVSYDLPKRGDGRFRLLQVKSSSSHCTWG